MDTILKAIPLDGFEIEVLTSSGIGSYGIQGEAANNPLNNQCPA